MRTRGDRTHRKTSDAIIQAKAEQARNAPTTDGEGLGPLEGVEHNPRDQVVSEGQGSGKVKVFEVNRDLARLLVNVPVDSLVWRIGVDPVSIIPKDALRAIVRLQAPSSKTEAEVEQVAALFLAAGAVAVKVQKQAGGTATVDAKAEEASLVHRRTLREVIDELVDASKFPDKVALRRVVDEAIAEGSSSTPEVEPTCTVPLYPTEIRLTNWLCFRGEHVVKLDADAYGVVARFESDPARSNWGGKSSTLGAIPFALFGAHSKQREDDWITQGEDSGGVELVLSDGSTVSRTRKRGQSNQIRFTRPGEGKASQTAAGAAVVSHLGLTEADFDVVAYARQKEVDLIVRAKPADRLALFVGWLPELSQLYQAETYLRRQLVAKTESARDQQATLERLTATLSALVGGKLDEVEPFKWQTSQEIDRLREMRGQKKAEASALRAGVTELQAWVSDGDKAKLYEAVESNINVLNARGVKSVAIYELELFSQKDFLERTRNVVMRVKAERDDIARWEADYEENKQFVAALAEFNRLESELAKLNEADLIGESERTRAQYVDATAAYRTAKGNVAMRQKLVDGLFDGNCPVASIECPAKGKINGQMKANRALLDKAIAEQDDAKAVLDVATDASETADEDLSSYRKVVSNRDSAKKDVERYRASAERIAKVGPPPERSEVEDRLNRAQLEFSAAEQKVRDSERALDSAKDLEWKLASLRNELASLLPAKQRIERDGLPPSDPKAAQDAVDRAWEVALGYEREAERLRHLLADFYANKRQIEDLKLSLSTSSDEVRLYREAVGIVGRMGAQRVVAEREVRRVEVIANDILANTGVDLTVQLRWGRESSTELATSCEECGSACSGKAKCCSRCGAERGPKVDPKLNLTLSNTSGGADDLAGLALRIAVGSWLRDRRGSPWRCLAVDEPFGALDGSNRRALAGYLVQAVRAGGYRQLIAVAHDSGSLDTMPNRIEILAGPNGSRYA